MRKPGPQQRRLVVEGVVQQQIPWEIVREVDVVKVNPHAGCKPWQHFQDEEVHVAAGLHRVRGIDEQQIALAQALELRYRDVLHRLGDDLQPHGLAWRGQHAPRVGIDATQGGRRLVRCQRLQHAVGGDAGANLHDGAWLDVPHHAVQRLGFDVAEAWADALRSAGPVVGCAGELPLVGPADPLARFQLGIEVAGDAGHGRWLVPLRHRPLELQHVRNGGVVMHRRHMQPKARADPEQPPQQQLG